MKRKEILQRLEERLARGEISEKTYLDIKARYDAEPEEPEIPPVPGPDLEASIRETVRRSTEQAGRASEDAARLVSESMRAVRESLGSMDFSGMGVRISGEEVRIVGSGAVSGNPVKTQEFRASGSAQVRGPLECEDVRVSGSCDFDGDVRCTEFRSSGSSRVAGSLHAQEMDASGSLEVTRDVDAKDISASGSLRVDGNVRSEDFRGSGGIRIQGELRAQDVLIELGGTSKIGTIQGQDIVVRPTGGFVRARGDLTADRIVGQDVSLAHTAAGYVEGQDVRIGPHCRIDVVAAQDLVVHESSEVRERRAPTT